MKKTEKVLDVWDMKIHMTCVKHFDDETAPYWIYYHWYNQGNHKKRMARAKTMPDVLGFCQHVMERVIDRENKQ